MVPPCVSPPGSPRARARAPPDPWTGSHTCDHTCVQGNKRRLKIAKRQFRTAEAMASDPHAEESVGSSRSSTMQHDHSARHHAATATAMSRSAGSTPETGRRRRPDMSQPMMMSASASMLLGLAGAGGDEFGGSVAESLRSSKSSLPGISGGAGEGDARGAEGDDEATAATGSTSASAAERRRRDYMARVREKGGEGKYGMLPSIESVGKSLAAKQEATAAAAFAASMALEAELSGSSKQGRLKGVAKSVSLITDSADGITSGGRRGGPSASASLLSSKAGSQVGGGGSAKMSDRERKRRLDAGLSVDPDGGEETTGTRPSRARSLASIYGADQTAPIREHARKPSIGLDAMPLDIPTLQARLSDGFSSRAWGGLRYCMSLNPRRWGGLRNCMLLNPRRMHTPPPSPPSSLTALSCYQSTKPLRPPIGTRQNARADSPKEPWREGTRESVGRLLGSQGASRAARDR